MSFHVFFAFSTGLACPIYAPHGTKASIHAHVEEVEKTLGLKHRDLPDGKICWDTSDQNYRNGFPGTDEKILCATIEKHNDWVRRLYDKFAK